MPEGVPFAGTTIEIDGTVVSKITSFSISYDISEEEVSGTEDTVGPAGAELTQQIFMATSVGKTAAIEGIAKDDSTGDVGQDALEDAAENGDIVVIQQYNQHDIGYRLRGFITNYEKTGSLPGIYTWSADFRIRERLSSGLTVVGRLKDITDWEFLYDANYGVTVNNSTDNYVLGVADQSSNGLNLGQDGSGSEILWTPNHTNGLPVLTFQGGKILTNTSIGSVTQPFAIVMASGTNDFDLLCSLNNHTVRVTRDGSDLYMYAGANLTYTEAEHATTLDVYTFIIDGANSSIRKNGVEVATGNAGTNDIANNVAWGGRVDTGDNPLAAVSATYGLLDSPTSQVISDVEDELIDNYGL